MPCPPAERPGTAVTAAPTVAGAAARTGAPARRHAFEGQSGHAHWRELFHEVVSADLCTGCAGCIVACPRDVLGVGADDRPVQIGAGMAVDACSIGDRGCDVCVRACPRFRNWEPALDREIVGRSRHADEPAGVTTRRLLARATDPEVLAVAQDGGLVSALLRWGIRTGRIDGALTSRVDDTSRPFDAAPHLVTTADDVLATAGSRYTFSSNLLAIDDAFEQGLNRLALVGMSCQASVPAALRANGERKLARRIALTIGLLCSKTFTYDGQRQVLGNHGVEMAEVTKINIKGRYQVWTQNGAYREIPLKEFHPFTRSACQACPDFAAQHADLSAGGIGAESGWTLVLVRTATGAQWIDGAVADSDLQVRDADEDPEALRLLSRLSTLSRRRWPHPDQPPAQVES